MTCPLSPVLRLAVLYLILVVLHAVYFVYRNGGGYWLIIFSAPPGFLFGLILYYLESVASRLPVRMFAGMRPLLAGFLLFFLFQVGYIVLFSVVVSLPVEWCLGMMNDSTQLARRYVLNSMSMIMVMALLSWLRWIMQLSGLRRQQRTG